MIERGNRMTNLVLDHATLKTKQRERREQFSDGLILRTHRALSWYGRAEAETDDNDVRFILSWIGFNALYAGDLHDSITRSNIENFFKVIVEMDPERRLYNLVWSRFSQEIRTLLNNHYVFGPYWDHHNGRAGFDNWKERFDKARADIHTALAEKNTARVLSLVFDRLYVLRNQLVHGGATWNGGVNRDQVRDGAAVMSCFLPLFIDLMMNHPQREWDVPHYPVVNV